jgi:hypothetical protein
MPAVGSCVPQVGPITSLADSTSIARPLEPEALHVGDGWLKCRLGSVEVTFMDGVVPDASFDQYLALLARSIDEHPDGLAFGVLFHVPDIASQNHARRKMLADVLGPRREKLARSTSAYAMATSSPVVRALLRMVFWLAPPSYPTATVATPRAGFDFIAQHSRRANAALLERSYAEVQRRYANGTLGKRA